VAALTIIYVFMANDMPFYTFEEETRSHYILFGMREDIESA
jgi:hypothetical protein